jgi:hypothetical protein
MARDKRKKKMVKTFKEVAHLYLGCDVMATYKKPFDFKGKFIGISMAEQAIVQHAPLAINQYSYENIKPLLRPLSDIQQEDLLPIKDNGLIPDFEILFQRFTGGYCIELDSVRDDGYCLTIYPDGSVWCICKDNNENYPYRGGELFAHLLSRGFDLFDLIPRGLAISQPSKDK